MQEYYYWLIFGVILILKDSLWLNSVFVLSFGVAALIISALLGTGIISSSNYFFQFSIFAILISIFTILIFIKRKTKSLQKFSNVVGDKAIIFEHSINDDIIGKLKWSGTIVKAKIAPSSSKQHFEVGEVVEIASVVGNVFYIKEGK
jgi:membrane protein implicated in regulation of membrane protease activity